MFFFFFFFFFVVFFFFCTLTADHADSLGSGDIDNSGVLKVGEGELENILSGSGSLVKTGTGELTLSGDNT
ncbi:AIDA autotransporter-like protein ShdA, partial [Salmonella enterica subsp. enterica serovar Newport str. SHSN010]